MATSKPSSAISLTRAELNLCKDLAELDGLQGQRAKALLAIHEGGTQASAAQVSELTLGQVRYVVSRFRQHRAQALQIDSQNTAVNATAPDTAVSPKSKKEPKKEKKKAKDKDKQPKKDKKKDKEKTKPDKKGKKDKKKSKKKK